MPIKVKICSVSTKDTIVDISSGVEDSSVVKNIGKLHDFLKKAKQL